MAEKLQGLQPFPGIYRSRLPENRHGRGPEAIRGRSGPSFIAIHQRLHLSKRQHIPAVLGEMVFQTLIANVM
jgi:hypothetical protein